MYFSSEFIQNLLNNCFPELSIKVVQDGCDFVNGKTYLHLKIHCIYGCIYFMHNANDYKSVKRIVDFYKNEMYLEEY